MRECPCLSFPLTNICGSGVQVSQVYQTMRISNLTHMISFFDFSTVEMVAVDAVKYNFVQVKIDHLKGVVSFGSQVIITSCLSNAIMSIVVSTTKVIE